MYFVYDDEIDDECEVLISDRQFRGICLIVLCVVDLVCVCVCVG